MEWPLKQPRAKRFNLLACIPASILITWKYFSKMDEGKCEGAVLKTGLVVNPIPEVHTEFSALSGPSLYSVVVIDNNNRKFILLSVLIHVNFRTVCGFIY